jgi:hypothetical protein
VAAEGGAVQPVTVEVEAGSLISAPGASSAPAVTYQDAVSVSAISTIVRDGRSNTGKVSIAPASQVAWSVTCVPPAIAAGSIRLPSAAVNVSPASDGFWLAWYAAWNARASASDASGRSQVTRSRPTASAPPSATVTG